MYVVLLMRDGVEGRKMTMKLTLCMDVLMSDHIIYGRVFTIHGTSDEIIPVEDAFEFAKIIPNHKLHIIEGADHGYTNHQDELSSVIVNFIKETLHQDNGTTS